MIGVPDSPLKGRTIDPDALETFLVDNPGTTEAALRAGLSLDETRALTVAIMKLISERRLSTVKYVWNAPFLNATYHYFAMAHGRIEVVDTDSMSLAYVHDPLGTWQRAMDEAFEADRG